MEISPEFRCDESLLRAVFPADRRPDLWNGKRLSSSAFKDKRGASVDRTYDRSMEESVAFLQEKLQGYLVSVSVENCKEVNAIIKYLPSDTDIFHSEIHRSEDIKLLDEVQAYHLARVAIIQYDPTASISYI